MAETKTPDNLPSTVKGSPGPAQATPKFDALMLQAQKDVAEVPGDAYDAILQQILTAESPDLVLTPTEAINADEVVGIPFDFQGFEWNKSEFDAGSPMYASIRVTDLGTGDHKVVNCGHKKVLAQLIRLEQLHAIPFKAMFVQRGVSRVGTPMLELRKLPDFEDGDKQEPPF